MKYPPDMNKYLSPLAVLIPQPQDTVNRTKARPYGLMLHTTGRGLLDQAKKAKRSPLATAIDIYTKRKGYGPHYVLDQDGDLIQIADERERMGHAGVTAAERELYLSGKWQEKVSKTTALRWMEWWFVGQQVKSPSHLYPSTSPNNDYVGIELIPNSRAKFADRQYEVLRAFIQDFEQRYDLDLLSTAFIPNRHLLGHEDAEPLNRSDRLGGWDPGAARAQPRFHWSLLKRGVA